MLAPMHLQDGPLTRLRRGHEELVLGLLRRHGPQSRAELGHRAGLSRTTLHDIVATLVSSGAVVGEPASPAPRKRGRPVERLRLNPATGQAVGIDFARRAVHVAVANVAHEIIGTAGAEHAPRLPWPRRVALAERLVGSIDAGSLRLSALGVVGAIGVGLVGPVPVADPDPDVSAAEPRFREHEEPVRLLAERFGAPVLADNNTRLAALAEATWGAAVGSADTLYLRLSHGVGGGLLLGGALHRGLGGLSGEFGHITVEEDGRPCGCGGAGCLETVASVGAVLDAYREHGGTAEGLGELIAAVRRGDPRALAVLERAGRLTGQVLASVCNAVGPGTVVLGGELLAAEEALTGPLRSALDRHLLPAARSRVRVVGAALGERGGALGGIALALHSAPSPAAPLPPRAPAAPAPVPVPPDRESATRTGSPLLRPPVDA
ncbi:ROK family protein [Streptomyces sp. NPDC049954]|uniref:ROK family protein n=1 Tax=Streptomyces sp. NPDC049954 TaxID=3155779 RepID=UPI00342FEF59